MASSITSTETSPFGDKNLPACTTPIDVKVDGQIPEWVHGVLYRVGKQSVCLFPPLDDDREKRRLELTESRILCVICNQNSNNQFLQITDNVATESISELVLSFLNV
jgi:hypothetical protein